MLLSAVAVKTLYRSAFQWAPTLGGECYLSDEWWETADQCLFQWAPTLGGECYRANAGAPARAKTGSFNGHPPLGVNATFPARGYTPRGERRFQWAPTLGGECYTGDDRFPCVGLYRFNGHPPLGVNATDRILTPALPTAERFNGHPPLGVNATGAQARPPQRSFRHVSMGTHPWG